MPADKNDKKKFKEKLKDTYRIVVIDVEDLKEVGNYQLSMGQIYMYLLSGMLLFTVILVSLIAFTPLKRLTPGYGDIEENTKFVELRKKIINIEEELEIQIVYTQGLQNMLSGNGDVSNTIPQSNMLPLTGKSNEVISDADLRESKITRYLENQYFVPPLLGVISAAYDRANNHLGTDIIAPKDTPIKAISSGVVVSSDFTLDTGNTISVQHQNNVISIYKHNSALLKKSGDKVSAGEAIAIIGNTGELTDGPHLHFELWYNGNPVNPENFINFK
ncbi:MAG: murein DD-endopeptidase MepM/ murein hydrolase activator NlpD [Saprospiraceae bacterium]|jgi:murein DD-endopeptidase MepM/ murein hydrolase activator NlpD